MGLSKTSLPIGGLSRNCAETLRCPDNLEEPELFCDFLEETCSRIRPTVFLPLEDVVIEICLAHPERWQPYTKALLPSPEVMEISYDKWKTIELANRVGVPVPHSHCPDSIDEVAAIAADWSPVSAAPREPEETHP